ncbi:unnamed protein product [Sympodiomycopsis kandeliae]
MATVLYHPDFLEKRNWELHLVWRAATIGGSSSLHKLKKREIDSLNIVKACKQVSNPAQPLALRLRSQLLFGVVRVYSHKSVQLFNDITNAHRNIRRALADMTLSNINSIVPMGTNIDMQTGDNATSRRGNTSASGNPITLSQDLFTCDFTAPFDWTWEEYLNRGGSGMPPGTGNSQSWSSGIGSDQLQSLTSPSQTYSGLRTPMHTPPPLNSQQRTPSKHIGSKEKINESQYRDSAYDDHPDFFENGRRDGEASQEGYLGIGGGDADSAGSEGGGFGFADMQNGHPGDLDLGLELDGDDDNNHNLLAQGQVGGQTPNTRSRHASVNPNGLQAIDDGGEYPAFDDGLDFAFHDHETQPGTPISQSGAPLQSDSRSRKRTLSTMLEDADTELRGYRDAHEQHIAYLALMRHHHEQKSKVIQKQHDLRNDYGEQLQMGGAKECVLFQIDSDVIMAQPLVDLWKGSVGAEAERIDAALKKVKKQFVSGAKTTLSPLDPGLAHTNGHIDNSNNHDHGHADGGHSQFGGNDDQGGYDNFDNGDFDIPGLETIPAAEQTIGGETTLGSVEIGRRNILPSPGHASNSGAWDFGAAGSDHNGSIRGDGTPRHRREMSVGSVGGGGILPYLGSAPQSPVSRNGGLSGVLNSQLSLQRAMANGGDSLAEGRGHSESHHLRTEGTAEATKFIEFAKTMAAEVRPQPLFFSDLAPRTDTEPGTAARGFYNLLATATSGHLTVRQDAPYAEIYVELPEEAIEQADGRDPHSDNGGDATSRDGSPGEGYVNGETNGFEQDESLKEEEEDYL